MSREIDRARNDDTESTEDSDGQLANPGPVPAEPEDVSDAGEGRLAPQPGSDRMDED